MAKDSVCSKMMTLLDLLKRNFLTTDIGFGIPGEIRVGRNGDMYMPEVAPDQPFLGPDWKPVGDERAKCVDLQSLCLRLISHWQYCDQKLPSCHFDRLVENERTLPEEPVWNLAGLPEGWLFQRAQLNVYRLVADGEKRKGVTLRNFFRDDCALQFAQRQDIYLRMRLAYAGGFIPLAILKFMKFFQEDGFHYFILPNGHLIPFGMLTYMIAAIEPLGVNVMKVDRERAGQLVRNISSAAIECLNVFPQGRVTLSHVLLGLHLPAAQAGGVGGRFVIDPTSMQFGVRGPQERLFFYGWMEDYMRVFPGRNFHFHPVHDPAMQQHLERHANQAEMLDTLMGGVMATYSLRHCGHCGNVAHPGTIFNDPVKLATCTGCEQVQFCDRSCQKAAWKWHKAQCVSQSQSKGAAEQPSPAPPASQSQGRKAALSAKQPLQTPPLSSLTGSAQGKSPAPLGNSSEGSGGSSAAQKKKARMGGSKSKKARQNNQNQTSKAT